MIVKIFILIIFQCSFIFAGYSITEANVTCAGMSCQIPAINNNECNYAYDATLDRINGDDQNIPAVFDVWCQANKSNAPYCIDNIFKFSYSYSLNKYIKVEEFDCNGDQTSLCPGRTNSSDPDNKPNGDAYASPKFLRDSQGHEFLFFLHGSADIYNGNIQFKYRSGSNSVWSSYVNLFTISTKNIESCDCRGGFGRLTAIEVGNYIYF